MLRCRGVGGFSSLLIASIFFFFCIRFLSKVIMLQPKVKKLEKVSEV